MQHKPLRALESMHNELTIHGMLDQRHQPVHNAEMLMIVLAELEDAFDRHTACACSICLTDWSCTGSSTTYMIATIFSRLPPTA